MPGQELRMARVRASREHSDVRSGFRHLIIMKTADSGFEGFKRDRLTTLGATADRLLATDASADWGYAVQAPSFRETHRQVRETLLTSFANHQSRSVQHTLYAMGEAVLTAIAAVADIRLTMPNIHCLPVDLSRFGQDNPNEIFVPVDEPHGYIRAHIKR
jgi:urate oxidase